MEEGWHYVGPYRVPIGLRFAPSDEELALNFLRPWALGQKFLPGLVRHLDIYHYHPADLLADAPTKKAYFFTELKQMFMSGDKAIRTAGNGIWKVSRTVDRIYDSDGTEVACKRLLVYHKEEGMKSFKTDWLMHEYKLLDSNKVKVLCKVYLKERKAMKDSLAACSTSGRDEARVQATPSNCYDLVAMPTDPSQSSERPQEMHHLAQLFQKDSGSTGHNPSSRMRELALLTEKEESAAASVHQGESSSDPRLKELRKEARAESKRRWWEGPRELKRPHPTPSNDSHLRGNNGKGVGSFAEHVRQCVEHIRQHDGKRMKKTSPSIHPE